MEKKEKVFYPTWLKEYADTSYGDEQNKVYEKYEEFYKPKLLLNDDRFLIMDWENLENPDISYRYFLRKDIGMFNMYHDEKLYEITARWFIPVSLLDVLNTMRYMRDIAGKVTCGDESLIGWNNELACKKFKEIREEDESFFGEDPEAIEDVLKDYDDMEEMLKRYGAAEVANVDEFNELWYKYHDYDEPVSDLGSTVSAFMYWGIKGFFQCCMETGLVEVVK